MDELAFSLQLLKSGEPFSTTRLAHGFWESCLRLRRETGGTLDWREVADPAKIDLAAKTPQFLETGFLSEILLLITPIW